MSGEIMNSYKLTILFSSLTTRHVSKLYQKIVGTMDLLRYMVHMDMMT